jgi:hypothetical protein
MGFNGAQGEVQAVGDLLLGQPLALEIGDLALARRELMHT